jgi:hypothetical protein
VGEAAGPEAGPAAVAASAATAAYRVEVDRGDQGWEVRIVAGDGRPASVRPCASETEARTYASTVIQHLGWLSTAKFREYYRLER